MNCILKVSKPFLDLYYALNQMFVNIGDESMTNNWNADPIQVLVGLVTRAQAKKFKETLNGLIHNIWVEVNLWRPKEDALHVPQGWISMIQALE